MKNTVTILIFLLGFVMMSCESDPGKTIFEDRNFANSSKKVSCNFCHNGGSKLNGTAQKTVFEKDGKTYNSIESFINQVMIKDFTKGQPIDENSKQMKDLVTYIKKISK